MFNFYEVLAGHDMVTDADRATTRRRKFKTPSLQKVKKMKDLPKTWILTGKQFEDYRRKKDQKQYSRPSRKNPMENKEPCRYQLIMAFVNSKS